MVARSAKDLKNIASEIDEDKQWELDKHEQGSLTGKGWNHHTSIDEISKKFGLDISELIQKQLDESDKPVRFLDVGCFDGKALREIEDRFAESVKSGKLELHGLSLIAHDDWNQSKNINWHTGSIELTDLPSDYFHILLTHSALNHIENSSSEMRKNMTYESIHRLLKPNGELLATPTQLVLLDKKSLAEKGFKEIHHGADMTLHARKLVK